MKNKYEHFFLPFEMKTLIYFVENDFSKQDDLKMLFTLFEQA